MVDKQRLWVFFFCLQCADILEHCLEIIGHLRHKKTDNKTECKIPFFESKNTIKTGR